MDSGNVDDEKFAAFVRKNGDVDPNEFPKNAIKAAETAEKEFDEATAQITPLLRASRDLTTLTALKAMSDSKDTAAMNQYMSMLQCENIPIFKIPEKDKE